MNPNPIWPAIIGAIVGALLSIGGGALGNLIKDWSDKRAERKYIAISLCDELDEIKSVIEKLESTWDQTGQVFKPNIIELSKNTATFDNLRIRLFVFKKPGDRKEISGFYKKLKKAIEDSVDKVGTLDQSDTGKAQQENIKTKFCDLIREANTLIETLKKNT